MPGPVRHLPRRNCLPGLVTARNRRCSTRFSSDWERWAAEVLESHLSYPALSFFRSQHNNQSWLGALITILDGSALVMAGVEGLRNEQAKITFAMARHAMVDLAQVVNARYNPGRSRPAAAGGI